MAYADGTLSKLSGNGPTGSQLWVYTSPDAHATVSGSNYFPGKGTPGDMGLRVNDVVIAVKTTATIGATLHVVTETSADGATVSAAILA